MKRFKKLSYIVLIVIIIILTVIIYFSTNSKGSENQEKKVISEIRYVESKLVNLLNTMNNIESRNYKVSVSQVSKETSKNSEGKSSSSGGSDSSEQSGNSGQSNQEGQGGQESAENKNKNKKFELINNGVLTNNEDINWDNVKSEIENMYTSIPTITIDLYQLNLNKEDILNFNKEYDNLTVAVQNEKKEEVLSQLSKVYEFMPKFMKNNSGEEIYKKVIETKSNIFKAYSKLDSEDWKQIEDDVNKAIEVYSQLLSDTTVDSSKQYDLSKCYIMLNELQNSVRLKDKGVFLIKYKNLIEGFNSI